MTLVHGVSRGCGAGVQTGRLQRRQKLTSLSRKAEGEVPGDKESFIIN